MTPRTSFASGLKRVDHLQVYLGASLDELESLASDLDVGRRVETSLVRAKGKERLITFPTDEAVINIHRRLLAMLTPAQLDLPENVTGYVRGRSSMENSRAHVGNLFLQKFDLKDFFSHITTDMVEAGLREVGYNKQIAAVLARIGTCEGILPTGFSTSPALANLACWHLDSDLLRLAKVNHLVVTRYADDISFSGQERFDVADQVRTIVEDCGHKLNDAKTRTLKHGQPLYVTGLSISESDQPRLPRPFKKKLRQEMYFISCFGLKGHAARVGQFPDKLGFRLGGQLAYASSVEPVWVQSLAREYATAFKLVARKKYSRSAEKRRARLVALARRIGTRAEPVPSRYVPSQTIAGAEV